MIKRISKYLVMLVSTTLLATGIFFSTTTTGLQLIINIATHFTPGKLHIGSVSGALNKVIIIKDFYYKNQHIAITSPQLQLRIRPLALLLNKLYVSFLQANTLHITRFTIQQSEQTKSTVAPKFILPIKLKLRNIAVEQLILQQDDKKYQFNHFMLNAFIKSNHLDVSNLQSDVGQLRYSLQGKLDLIPLHLILHISQYKHHAIVSQGTIDASGNWKKLTVQSLLKVPLPITATTTINNLLTTPTWQFSGNIKNANLEKIAKIVDYKNVIGTFSGHGDTKVASFSAKLLPDENVPSAYLTAHLSSESLQQKQFTATLQWHNLALPNINSPQGYISVSGKPTNYHFNSNITMDGGKIPYGTWQLQGNGDLYHLAITDLKAKMLKGLLTATVNLNWQSSVSYIVNFSAQHLHPQQQWINWYGDISLHGIVKGNQDNIKLSLYNLNGYLRQQRLFGSFSAQVIKHQLVAAVSNISIGKAKFNFIFSQQHQLQARWNINIPSLAKLIPYGNGELRSQGRLQKTDSSSNINGSVNGKNLAWRTYQLGRFNSNFILAVKPNRRSQVRLQATAIKLPHYNFDNLYLAVIGTRSQHHIDLHIGRYHENLYTQALGHYKNKQWQLDFTRFTLINKRAKTWQLLKPFKVYLAKNTLQLTNFIWQAGTQTIKVNFNWQQQVLRKLALNLNNISLTLLNPFLPDTINLQGKFNLQANYQQQQTASGNLIANLRDGKIYYPLKKRQQTLVIHSANWHACLNNTKLTSLLNLRLNDNNYLNANLSSTDFKLRHWLDMQTHWQGELQTHLDHLEFLTLVFPLLNMLNGELDTQLKWDGTLKTPHLQGYVKINKGAATLPEQGLQLKAISFKATAAANKIAYQLRATSGKGTVMVDGNSDLSKHDKTALSITGNNITIINTPEYQIVATPKLHVLMQKHHIDLSGELYLPTISIDQSHYLDVITLPNDIVITQQANKSRNHTFWDNLRLKIKLILGKHVYFKNDQLKAQLSGSLLLSDNSKHMRADGKLIINHGIFTVFGQTLTIKNGRLIYVGGAITNPGLDIKATKTITTFVSPVQNSLTQINLTTDKTSSQQLNIPLQQKIITVGIKVSDRLENPHITLFSNPSNLSREDIISYLIFGYPMSEASNGQLQVLWHALSALSANNRGGYAIITKIKRRLSLDQIGLQSDTFFNPKTNAVKQNTSLVLGKILSPKLYVQYSIGLVEPINTLIATYQFNRYFSAQTKTNSFGNSIDIVYTHEQNHWLS